MQHGDGGMAGRCRPRPGRRSSEWPRPATGLATVTFTAPASDGGAAITSSTLILKLSYLFYVLVLCIIVYLSALVKGGLDKVFYGIEFFAFLIVLFAPTTGFLQGN